MAQMPPVAPTTGNHPSSSMDDQFLSQGIRFVEEAIREDNEGNFSKALNLYTQSLRYFMAKLKYEKNPKVKEVLTERVNGYMRRAEELKEHLAQSHPPVAPGSAAGAHSEGKAAEASSGHMDVEAELAKIVGQDEIKELLRSMRHELRLDTRRRELGFAIAQLKAPNILMTGNPGTGKTTIARLVAASLFELGIIERNVLVEVQRADLVAGHIGQTAPKTRERLAEARGGVLFVDEAYRLVNSSKQDFGSEALNELMSAMEAGDPVMIFAGYEEQMEEFINTNPGLFRRVEYQFHFRDYTPQQMATILCLKVRASGFKLEEGLGEAQLAEVIERYTTERQRSLMNGGLAAMMVKRAKRALDSRLTPDCPAEVLCTYTLQDMVVAAQGLPVPTGNVGTEIEVRPQE